MRKPRLWLVCLVVGAVLCAPFVGAAMDGPSADATRQAAGGSGDAGDPASLGAAGGAAPASAAPVGGDPAATIGVGSTEAGPGETVTLAIAVDGDDVAGYQANLSWDPSVLQFESIEGVDFADPVTNVDADAGWVAMTQSSADGMASPTVAEVTFTVVGDPGTTSALAFVPGETSVNNESSQLETAVENGSVAVSDGTPPVADPGDDRTVGVGTTVTFDGGNSTDDAGIASYTWTMGDGTTLSGETVTHAYDAVGAYTVSLTVTDVGGNTDTANLTVTVADTTAPVADPGDDRTVDEDTTVTFDGSDSTDDVGVESYEWTFDDGSTATGETVTRSYGVPGTYEVALTVADAAGNTDTANLTVTVADTVAPDADAGPDVTTTVGEPVGFDGTGTTDDGGVESYEWSFGDGGTATGATPTHTFDQPGTYEVTLEATDAAGNTGTDTTTVTVSEGDDGDDGNDGGTDPPQVEPPDDGGDGDESAGGTSPPEADAGGDYVANVSEPVAFDATNSTDDAGITNVSWTFEDGATATGMTPTHAFDRPGTYNATVTVTDAAGNTDTDTATVTIREVNVVSTDGSLADGLTVDVDRARAGTTLTVPLDGSGAVSASNLTLDVGRAGSFELTVRTHTGDDMALSADRRALGGLSVSGGMDHVARAETQLTVAAAGASADEDSVRLLERDDGEWERLNQSVWMNEGNVATADLSLDESGTVAVALAESEAPATTAGDPAQPAEPAPTAAPDGEGDARPSLGAIVLVAGGILLGLAVAFRLARE